jgi:hypothetical protein
MNNLPISPRSVVSRSESPSAVSIGGLPAHVPLWAVFPALNLRRK